MPVDFLFDVDFFVPVDFLVPVPVDFLVAEAVLAGILMVWPARRLSEVCILYTTDAADE